MLQAVDAQDWIGWCAIRFVAVHGTSVNRPPRFARGYEYRGLPVIDGRAIRFIASMNHYPPSRRRAEAACLRGLSCLALTCAAGIAAPARAAPFEWANDLYLGASIGQARSPMDARGVSSRVLAPGTPTTDLVRFEPKHAVDLFVGKTLSPTVAVEAGWFHYQPFGFTADTVDHGTLSGSVAVQGGFIDFLGSRPLVAGLSAHARLGLHVDDVRDRFDIADRSVLATTGLHRTSVNYDAGVGLDYRLARALTLRVDATRHRLDKGIGRDVNVGVYSLGLVYAFGKASEVPRSTAIAERTEVGADAKDVPAPARPSLPAPVDGVTDAPAPQRRELQADTSFAFDSATLTASARAALDAFVTELGASTRIASATFTGHTDVLGSVAYNQALSTRRAEAVRDYLAARPPFAGAQSQVLGKGSSEPVTREGQCPPSQALAQRIACLQPDRRVDIDVTLSR